jgi:hypothetical protein
MRGHALVLVTIAAACGQSDAPAPAPSTDPAPRGTTSTPAPAPTGPQLPPGPLAPEVVASGAQALARQHETRCKPGVREVTGGTFHRADLAPLLARTGADFVKAYEQHSFGMRVDPCELSSEDLWKLVDKVRAAEKDFDPAWKYSAELGSLADAIAERSTAGDYARLVGLAETARTGASAPALDAVIDLRVAETIAGLLAMRPPPVETRAATTAAPDAVRAADPSLREAWARYRGLVDAAARPAPTIDIHPHWADFDRAVLAMLRGEPGDHVAAIAAFRWGGDCGTGSEALAHPQGRALVAAHLAAGNHALAAGEMLLASTSMVAGGDDEVRRRYLAWLGLDWTQLYAGAVADGHGEHVDALAAAGGDAGARYLVAIDSLPLDNWARDRYLRALGSVISPMRDDRPPVSADLQRAAIAVLASHVRTGETPEVVAAAVESLALRAADTRADLRRALALPYERAAQLAANALQGLGEAVASPVARPVRVEVTVDGNPLASRDIRWELGLGNTSTSSTRTTDADGVFALDRDYFTGKLPDRMSFGTGEIGGLDEVWFQHSVAGPSGIPDVIRVDIRTGVLAIDVADGDLPRGPATGDRTLAIHRVDLPDAPGGVAFVNLMGITLGPAKTITLPRLQRGSYHLELKWPGAAPWRERVEIGEGTARITAKLARPPAKP